MGGCLRITTIRKCMPIVYICMMGTYYCIMVITDICMDYSKCDSKGSDEDYAYLSKNDLVRTNIS